MAAPTARPSNRERILTAAEDVVLRRGVAHLTLASAAEEAGVSKGGVLYHFPTRDALVAAMVTRLVDAFEAELALAEAEIAAEDGGAAELTAAASGLALDRSGSAAAEGGGSEELPRVGSRDRGTAEPTRPGSGRFTRAYVRCAVRPPMTEDERRQERVGAAVLAAMAAEPELLAPLREAFAGWQARIEADGEDPVTATVLRMAADGLWLTELFGLAQLAPAARRRLADRLEELAR